MAIELHHGDLPDNLDFGSSVAIDTETMGLDPNRDRLCLAQLSAGDGNAHLVKIAIRDLFDGVVSAVMAGAAKPERPIFDMAVEVGGAGAAETLHVGDHPLYDVHGARNAGLHAVWVNRNGDQWPEDYDLPHAEVQHVGELGALLSETCS